MKTPIKNKIIIVLCGIYMSSLILGSAFITGFFFWTWLTYEIVKPEDTISVFGELKSAKKFARKRDTACIIIFLKNKHIRFRSSIGFPEYFKRDDFLEEAQVGDSVKLIVHKKFSDRLTSPENDKIETVNVIGLKVSGKDYLTIDEYIEWDKNNKQWAGYGSLILLLATIFLFLSLGRIFLQLYKKRLST